ncbi:MAG: peptidase M24 [Parcubacteria group bacterium Gr01-1014_31]|nr:MAG: peptidase M24 [Parcubacteria group bacterium Gr01-1014_31]
MKRRAAWTKAQLAAHLAAARLLEQVRDEVWWYLRSQRRASERATQEFVLGRFRRYGLRNELSRPIVAFGAHTGEVHYFPPARGSARFRRGTWVLLDLWARLQQPGAPYADATWMAWYGSRVPTRLARAFAAVRAARDASLRYLLTQTASGAVPSGAALDGVARRSLHRAGFRGKFTHSLGHSLGLHGPHGSQGPLSPKNPKSLVPGVGYTIEPGIYLPGRYGVRLEMDLMLTSERQVIVTTALQQNIIRLSAG